MERLRALRVGTLTAVALAGALVAFAVAGLLPAAGTARGGPPARAASSADPLCTADYSGAAPAPPTQPVRFGIDPGVAGSVGGAQLPTVPDDVGNDVSFSSQLRPAGKVLVVRLNRLFWSGGEPLIDQFRALVAQYDRAGSRSSSRSATTRRPGTTATSRRGRRTSATSSTCSAATRTSWR